MTFKGCGLVLLASVCAVVPAAAAITLPDPLAIEIPVEGQTTINAADPPLRDLLGSATSPMGPVTHDKQNVIFPLGPTLVTWSDGTANTSAYVYVYPFGQTPVGSTAYERATSGNGASNVVRDRLGKIHVAWLDSGRGVDRVLYRRGTQAPDTGAITWETPPLRISEDANDGWNSMVGVAVSDNYVHFAWYGGNNSSYYRRLRLSDYSLGPVRNTTAAGSLSDCGPDLAVRGDDEVHVVTPADGASGGQHALSTDGGLTWAVESIPRPQGGIGMKATSVAVDEHGNTHVVFPWMIRNSKFGSWSDTVPNRAFWQLRYVRRTAQGVWVDAQYVLAQFPEWGDPLTDGNPANDDWDVLSDWVDIAVDRHDDIHVAWHGPLHTHIFANDEAFYIRRPATGPGTWPSAWDPYISLWPVTMGFSYAPSICVDADSRVAMPVVFHDTSNAYEFDSNFKLIRNGVWDGNQPLPLTTMAADGYGLSGWFPSAAPTLFTHPNGRVWLDVVATDWPAEAGSDMLIVLKRRELTNWLREVPTLTVRSSQLAWTALSGATGYDVVRGDLQILRGSGGDFTAATVECLSNDDPLTFLAYVGNPAPGRGFWFLVRGTDAFGGLTYESLRDSQIGTRDNEIRLAPGACL
jgi:hypothetical protein